MNKTFSAGKRLSGLIPRAHAEENLPLAYQNSWRILNKRLAQIGRELYCLGPVSTGFIGYSTLYRVAFGQLEPIIRRCKMEEIAPFGDQMFICRYSDDFFEIIYNFSSDAVIELLNLSTKEFKSLVSYNKEASPICEIFTIGDALYGVERGGVDAYRLYQYVAENQKRLLSPMRKSGGIYPSFYLLDHEEKPDASSHAWQTAIRLYDFDSREIYQTSRPIALFSLTPEPQAVLVGRKLNYLAPDGIRRWDFAENRDDLILPLPESRYSKFSLLNDRILLFRVQEDAMQADLYDLTDGSPLRSFSLSVRPDEVFMNACSLHLYDDSASLECFDLQTEEHHVLTVR